MKEVMVLLFFTNLVFANFTDPAKVQSYQERFASVQNTLQEKTFKIADFMAPRFIDPSLWEKVKREKSYDPTTIYNPAPVTWNQWEDAESVLRSNKKLLSVEELETLLLQINLNTQKDILVNAGHYRSAPGISGTFPLSKEELVTIDRELKGYLTVESGFDTCKDLPKDNVCARFIYTDPSQIKEKVEKHLAYILSLIQVGLHDPNIALNPISLAAQAQRKMVAIHPYNDGNGRTSRFLMDYVLMMFDLPPAILLNMNRDLSTFQREWNKEVEEGIERSLTILENCARDSEQEACKVLPR